MYNIQVCDDGFWQLWVSTTGLINELNLSMVNNYKNISIRFSSKTKIMKLIVPSCESVDLLDSDLLSEITDINWNYVNIIRICRYGYITDNWDWQWKISANYIRIRNSMIASYIRDDFLNLRYLELDTIPTILKCIYAAKLHRYIPKPILWKILTSIIIV